MNYEAYKICEARTVEVIGADAVSDIHMAAHDNAAQTIADNGGDWRVTGVDSEFLRHWLGSVEGILSDCHDDHAIEFFANLGIRG